MLDLSQPRNLAGAVLAGFGAVFVILTYAAYAASRRGGRYVSGFPILGGLLIAVGFLITENRWLALLALTDPGFLMLPYALIRDHRDRNRFPAVFGSAIQAHGFQTPPHPGERYIRITTPADSLTHWFQYLHPYYLRVPHIAFMLCADAEGNGYLLLDRYTGSKAELLPFDGSRITVDDIVYRNQTVSVTVEILQEIDRQNL